MAPSTSRYRNILSEGAPFGGSFALFYLLQEEKEMAVKIRLRRMGQKKAPFYRIVVADSRCKRDGRCIEEIGTYDPNLEPSAVTVDEEAAKKWLAAGAQPTDVVAKILKDAGIEK